MVERLSKVNVKRIFAMVLSVIVVLTSINLDSIAVEAATVKATSVTLNHTNYTMKKGAKLTLKATIKPAKSTQKTLQWSTSNNKVATVSSKGVVKALKKGTATITVKVKGTTKKASCKIIVGTPVTKVAVSKKTVTINVGATSKIKTTVTPKTASNKKVTYTSSNKAIATVSSKGTITGKKAGTAYITVKATDGSKKSAKVKVVVKNVKAKKVTVKASKTTLTVGSSVTAKVTFSPTNTTNKAVKWTSSNTAVATVSTKGKITAKKAGTATIKATAKDGSKKYGTIKITVKNISVTSVKVSAEKTELEIGDTVTAKAVVSPSNATIKKVKWTSSDTAIATVSTAGKVTAKKAGTVVIKATATDGSKKYGSVTIKVKEDATLYIPTSGTYDELNMGDDSITGGYKYNFETIDLVEVDGVEKIRLTSSHHLYLQNEWETIVFSNDNVDCEYNITESDDLHYLQIIVDDEVYKTYPLYYEIYIDRMVDVDVSLTDNYLIYHWLNPRENSKDGELLIYGDNATIGQFSVVKTEYCDSDVTLGDIIDCDDSANGLAYFTAKYQTQEKKYWVVYEQKPRPLPIESISDGTEIFFIKDYSLIDTSGYGFTYSPRIYEVSGTKEALDGTEAFNFGFDVASKVFTADNSDDRWNYRIDVVYENGLTNKVYILYTQDEEINVVPTSGHVYTNYDYDYDIGTDVILCKEIDGVETIILLLSDEPEDIIWDNLILESSVSGASYNIVLDENDNYTVEVKLNDVLYKTYPLIYEYPLTSMFSPEVSNETNTIGYDGYSNMYDDAGYLDYCLMQIYGVDEELGTDLVITNIGSEDVIVGDITFVDDSEKGVAYFTVEYKNQSVVFWIEYIRDLRNLELNGISADGEIFSSDTIGEYGDINNDTLDDYIIYNVSGTKDALDGTEIFDFGFIPDDVTITSFDGANFNYIVNIEYRGLTGTILINYDTNVSLIPQSAIYTDAYDYVTYMNAVELIEIDGVEKVRFLGDINEEVFDFLGNWEFNHSSTALSYEIAESEEAGTYVLKIFTDGELVKEYEAIYEMYIDYVINANFAITDEGNYIVNSYVDIDYMDDIEYNVFRVIGEGESLGEEFTMDLTVESENTTYEVIKDNSMPYGIGLVHFEHGTQEKDAYICYSTEMRPIEYTNIKQSGYVFGCSTESDLYSYDYPVLSVYGTKPELDGSETFDFGRNYEVGFTPDSVVLTPDESEYWDYIVDISYNGMNTTIAIDYIVETDLLPDCGAHNTDNGGSISYSNIEYVEVDGVKKILISSWEADSVYEEESTWLSLDFTHIYYTQTLDYVIVPSETEPGTYFLEYRVGDEVLESYQIYYESDGSYETDESL